MLSTIHERPGVYSSYDASSIVAGGRANKVIGVAALAQNGESAGTVVTVTGYAAGVAAFGAMSVILIKGIHPLVAVLTSRMAPGAVGATAGVLLLLLLVDTAITTMRLLKLNEKLKQVHQHVIARIGESRLHAETMKKSVEEGIASLKTNGIASQMRELVQRLTKRDRRMLRSFPRFQSTRYGDVVDKLKEVLRGSK